MVFGCDSVRKGQGLILARLGPGKKNLKSQRRLGKKEKYFLKSRKDPIVATKALSGRYHEGYLVSPQEGGDHWYLARSRNHGSRPCCRRDEDDGVADRPEESGEADEGRWQRNGQN